MCVFAQNETGKFLYLPPLGKDVSSDVIEACFGMMEDVNRGSGVTRIENVTAEQLPLFPTDKYKCDLRGHEYCYDREDIALLKGNAYKPKRSSYNHFVGHYQHRYIPYSDEMITECLDLYQRWADGRRRAHPEDIYTHMLDENRTVHETVLRHCQPLGLTGRVVMVDGKIKAYTFGHEVNRDMFCVLFEISDLDVKGLSVYVFRELCRDAGLRRYRFINAMDDFGLENIRKTKQSFHPCVLLPAYVVTKK